MKKILRFVRDLDQALRLIAQSFVDLLGRILKAFLAKVLDTISRLWDFLMENESADDRETMAIAAIGPDLNDLDNFDGASSIGRILKESISSVDQLIVSLLGNNAPGEDETLSSILTNLAERVKSYALAFKIAIKDAIGDGFRHRSGRSRLEEILLGNLGGFQAKLASLAATESVAAGNRRIRQWAKAAGMRYVMRLAVMDDRTCQWCAARSGNVYLIDNAPKLLHPRDRCYYVPVSLDKVMSPEVKGFLTEHRQQLRKELSDRKLGFAYGLSPFEQLLGLIEPPTPFLSVDDLT